MNAVFKKMQFKDQDKVCVLAAPGEFAPHLKEMKGAARVDTSARTKKYPFVLVFVKSCAEVSKSAKKAVRLLDDDALLWFAFPKKASKRYETDLGRGDGWQPLGDEGFEAVRQVAIDQDWTALRFRHVDHIKTMKRASKRAMTKKGKKRTKR